MSNLIYFNVNVSQVDEYLDTITTKVDEQSNTHLKEMARLLTGAKGIEKYITQWNDNLRRSGQDESRWLFEQGEGFSSISVNYTGMTAQSRNDDFMVWWEFSKEYSPSMSGDAFYRLYSSPAYERTLGRDYAYFQETGIDELGIVDDDVPRRNRFYIEKGIEDTHKIILNKSAGYLKNIINNRR